MSRFLADNTFSGGPGLVRSHIRAGRAVKCVLSRCRSPNSSKNLRTLLWLGPNWHVKRTKREHKEVGGSMLASRLGNHNRAPAYSVAGSVKTDN